MQSISLLSLGVVLALGAAGTGPAYGQSSQELKVLQKRLNDLEAKTNRLESENEKLLNGAVTTTSDASKIKLSGPITELKLSGDLGLRYQWDNAQNQYYVNSKGELAHEHGENRSRFRYRLRLNVDFKLKDNWFGGFGLASNQYPDSGYTTFDQGFANDPIYISRAFVGWNAADWLTLIAGKQRNPFYRSDLTWDSNINPTGVVEVIEFHKLFGWGGVEEETVTSEDGKTVVSTTTKAVASPFELTLVAGQLYFDDNNEYNLYRANNRDALIFEQQLIATYRFNKKTSLTLAPAYFAYNGTKVNPDNVAPFSKTNSGLPLWVGETEGLSILEVPGDFTFNVAGAPVKLLWDVTYNFDGKERAEKIYGLTGAPIPITDSAGTVTRYLNGATHNSRDNLAWLVGFQIGENKKKHDWSVFLTYREVGLAAVDPNINEGTWGASRTNLRGWKGGVAYNFTDSVVAAATYYQADNLRKDLYGGNATGGAKVANLNNHQIFQFDLNVKF